MSQLTCITTSGGVGSSDKLNIQIKQVAILLDK